MKRTLFFMACVLASLTMSAQDDLTVGDIQNSGCLSMARGEESEPLPTIVLTKEGSVLSVQLLNYESVCGTSDFKVTPTVNDGKDGDPLSISINVVPCLAGDDFEDCLCPYNLSFMVHDVEDNSFYLSCWWYKGMVELTEGEPMVLEYKVEDVTIDGMSFRLLKVMHKAMLKDWTTVEKELLIPSEVNYDGEVYTVMAVSKDAFWHLDQATKVTVPKTVRSMDLDYDNAIWANPFRECKSLEWIEVEDGCPLFSSVEGVLFSKDKTMLLGYPIASPRETYTVPEGVTNIRSGAFHHNKYLRKLVIPEKVTDLGWHLFNDMKSLKELYIRGVIEPGCMSDLFDGMNTKAAVYVQPSEVEKYKAIYKGPVYPLAGGETDDSDYIPFVELGKVWHMVSHSGYPKSSLHFIRYKMTEEVERDGRTYTHTYLFDDDLATRQDIGLFREENRRVYKYDENTGKEIMLYDFSLKEGDTFTCYDVFNCKVLKQGWLYDGPKIVSYTNPASADTLETKYRRLRTWTIGLDNGTGEYHEITTWVEGVGALKNIFKPLVDGGRISLAYVERNDRTGYWENEYLPFSFCNNQLYGCNLPTGAADHSADWHHQLTYELEGDRLHVYGKAYTQCGLNNYAYFYERETDDPLVHKIEFVIQEVEPIATCAFLHATEFYVSGFDPNLNYIVVDNQGVEHPVINTTPQMAYRPFVEEGKVWKVGYGSRNPIQFVEYYYFEGDTIIDERICKQIMCQRYVTPDYSDYEVIMRYPLLQRRGVWYEDDKKVYVYDDTNNQFRLWYDFSADANDTVQICNQPYIVGPKQTGGIKGFKGVYRNVMWPTWDEEQIYDERQLYNNTTWLEGVGDIEGPIFNVYLGKEYHGGAFLMSCTVGDEVIYFNDEYEDGATPDAARKQRIDFTHTIKTRPKSRITRGAEASLYGEYNDQQLGINLDPLDETYLVRITDESGNAVYEKAVNAGNIVGLNIDISNYAEGRYTVTVENSNESFTGQFDAQTTSISLTPALSHREGAIYNLQGQRISSLRKGLNIVNGRKVFVKE
jgi:hypothetical protein